VEVFALFSSRFQSCPECGASVEPVAADVHTCDPERRASHIMAILQDQIADFEPRLHDYLSQPRGQFETWEAARQVRRTH